MIKLFDILNEWKLPPPTVPSKGYYKKAKEILLAKGYDTDSIKWIADAEWKSFGYDVSKINLALDKIKEYPNVEEYPDDLAEWKIGPSLPKGWVQMRDVSPLDYGDIIEEYAFQLNPGAEDTHGPIYDGVCYILKYPDEDFYRVKCSIFEYIADYYPIDDQVKNFKKYDNAKKFAFNSMIKVSKLVFR